MYVSNATSFKKIWGPISGSLSLTLLPPNLNPIHQAFETLTLPGARTRTWLLRRAGDQRSTTKLGKIHQKRLVVKKQQLHEEKFAPLGKQAKWSCPVCNAHDHHKVAAQVHYSYAWCYQLNTIGLCRTYSPASRIHCWVLLPFSGTSVLLEAIVLFAFNYTSQWFIYHTHCLPKHYISLQLWPGLPPVGGWLAFLFPYSIRNTCFEGYILYELTSCLSTSRQCMRFNLPSGAYWWEKDKVLFK